MKSICLKIPEELDARLAAELEGRGVNRSELIREALESYLARPKGAPAASFAALARDLAGCVEGPEDLSCAPEHLDGYGS